jgi:hypothetical protein
MRLRKSLAASNEELISLINKGYRVLQWMKQNHAMKKAANQFDDGKDNQPYQEAGDQWATEVVNALNSILPTELEANTFLYPNIPFGAVSGDYNFWSLHSRLTHFIKGLEVIRQQNLREYTDLPQGLRLFVEDIESFRKVRDVNPAQVADILDGGYLDRPEDSIQMALEQTLDVPMHKKDWGGEINDLYTSNVIVNGGRVETAFLLKGNGLRKRTLEIRDCGANGDQLVRLMESPARLFVVQFVGNVSESVIRDIEGKVEAARAKGREAWYCIMDGQDTARVLRAYGKC